MKDKTTWRGPYVESNAFEMCHKSTCHNGLISYRQIKAAVGLSRLKISTANYARTHIDAACSSGWHPCVGPAYCEMMPYDLLYSRTA